MRESRAHAAVNRSQLSMLRTAIKKAKSTAGTPQAGAALLTATKLLDRAGRKRLIHPNTAARYKSKLAKKAGT
jgi:small subunit ribosomal protein S20